MTDARRVPDPIAVVSRLPPGSAVILRDYDLPDRREFAETLRKATRSCGLRLLIGADWKLAWRIRADGLHLPEWALSRIPPFAPARGNWIVTAAVHTAAALMAAERAGVSAVLASPVFPTASHPGASTLGAARLAQLIRSTSLPVYALGGMSSVRFRRVQGTGAIGYAAIADLAPGSEVEIEAQEDRPAVVDARQLTA